MKHKLEWIETSVSSTVFKKTAERQCVITTRRYVARDPDGIRARARMNYFVCISNNDGTVEMAERFKTMEDAMFYATRHFIEREQH